MELLEEENLKTVKTYIKDNYEIDFIDDEYGCSNALSYTDKKAKKKCYIHLSEFYDKSSKYIGFDVEKIPYTSGSSGPVAYDENDINSFYAAIDEIMQNDFEYNRVLEKQTTIFDFID